MIDAVIRSIGGFTADVTIEEDSVDELVITKQPVEQGAAVTDHAYKQPVTLTVRAAWSNSSLSANGDPDYSASVYAQLLSLQVSRVPFTVQTGKRTYTNMLMQGLRQITDESSEYALVVDFHLQELIIVSTEVSSVPPTSQQANPQKTSGVVQSGTKQLAPAPTYNPG